MADETRDLGGEVEVDLDAHDDTDLEAAMREAVQAVEEVEAAGERAATPAAAAASPSDDIATLRRDLAEARDRSVRTLADFDNFRKRSERERQESRRYAMLEPLREVVGVMDNLERALSAGGSADDLKRGVEMILRQMQETMRRQGVSEVDATGQPFDPAVHEAVSREESPDVAAPTVTDTLMRGYFLHDRLLRPAMVKVAVPGEKKAPAGGDSAATGHAGAGGDGSAV
jgi:molecular chaperone GrpE